MRRKVINLHTPLDEVFGQRSKVALLRFLVRVRGVHSGRQLARATGLDSKTCHAALSDLVQQGVVRYTRAGTAILYSLIEESVLLKEIIQPAFGREDALLDGYASEIKRRIGRRVLSIVLFGSVVRGEERPKSDVDLFVITRYAGDEAELENELDRVADDLENRYGNSPQFIVMTRSEFRRKFMVGDSFVCEVFMTGRVLYGPRMERVLERVA